MEIGEESTIGKDRLQEGFFKRRLVRPVLDLLRQGVTPDKIALSVALGAALGVFPALGCSMALCTIAAIVLRLNLPLIQLVHYFLYPVQIALLVPFFRWGEKLFHAPHFPISVHQIYALFHAGVWTATKLLWTTIWHAIVVWGMIAPFFVGLIYVILLPLLRRAMRGQVLESNLPV
ncbi:MAG TPA: DUF2062 domain-containing protein [Candidatus Acidoferrum sp.]|nr:DUF2062 domain-containing protein [Candidatus Acidoferrum sp.]